MGIIEVIAGDLLERKQKVLQEMGACEAHGAEDRAALMLKELELINECIEFRKALFNVKSEGIS